MSLLFSSPFRSPLPLFTRRVRNRTRSFSSMTTASLSSMSPPPRAGALGFVLAHRFCRRRGCEQLLAASEGLLTPLPSPLKVQEVGKPDGTLSEALTRFGGGISLRGFVRHTCFYKPCVDIVMVRCKRGTTREPTRRPYNRGVCAGPEIEKTDERAETPLLLYSGRT